MLEDKQAIRFGCSVGRDGFRWAGLADVGRKVMWPRWTPPKEMIARSPEKAKWANGMPGGPDNPGAPRAPRADLGQSSARSPRWHLLRAPTILTAPELLTQECTSAVLPP